MTGKEVTVRFVRRGDSCPDNQSGNSDLIEQVFQAMKATESQCEWFSQEQCMTIKKKQRIFVYVFEEFRGDAFENIHSTGNRIYGPVCLQSCIQNDEHLPRSDSPVYSLAMRGLVVSCSSIEKKEREELHQLIQWMGGEVSKNFHEKVTHLVAGEVGSKKYIVAASLQKDIMCPDWVRDAWTDSQRKDIRATDPPYGAMQCPIFKGIVVTASGLDTYERTEVKEVVEKEGGRYSGEMKIKECTHLVIVNPRGQKYEFAKKWKIHIVTPKWLSDSLHAGYCLEEYRYAVGTDSVSSAGADQHTTSTPTKTDVPLSTSRLSSLSNVSAINSTHVNETHVNDTRLNDTTASLPQRQSMLPSRHTSPAELQAIDSLKLTAVNNDMFLDGCQSPCYNRHLRIKDTSIQIYLSGFTGARLEKLRRVINLGGGIRSSQITATVTHVVIADRADDCLKILEQADFRPHVVRVGWLLDSFQQGSCVSEESYVCIELPPLDALSPHHKQKVKKTSSTGAGDRTDTRTATRTTEVETRIHDEDDMHQLMSQYLSPSADMTDESALLIAAEAASQQLRAGDNDKTDEDKDADATLEQVAMDATTQDPCALDDITIDPDALPDLTRDPDVSELKAGSKDTSTAVEDPDASTQDPDATLEGEEGSLFRHRTFVVLGFCPEDQKQLQQFILESGGKVLSARSRQVPHYAVVPVFGCPVNRTVSDIVTNAWLQMCIESNTLLPPSGNELFTPMSVHPGKEPLQECVLSISGYTGTERDVLVHIAELIGARCQEYFVKNSNVNRNLLPSTHLVVNAATGSKYNAAKKWGLPAISKHWLFESARTGERAPEEQFLIDGATSAPKSNRKQPPEKETEKCNRSTSTPKPTVRQSTGNVSATNSVSATTPVGVKPSTPIGVKPVTPGPLQDPDCQQTDTPVGKENDTRRLSRQPQDTPTQGGADSNHRLSTAGPSSETLGLRNHRVKALIDDNKKSSPRPNSPKVAPGMDTPSKFLNTSKPFLPTFDLTDAMACLDSPAGPTTPGAKVERRASTPLGELLTRNLMIAIENCQRAPGKAMDIDQVAGASTTATVRQDSPQPLQGVVIAVSKKLSSRQGEYNNIAASLGAEFRWTYDNSCTHFIFRGRPNDTNREFRLAREQGKVIVSPHWLLACQEQEMRVDEGLYPHQFNPNMSLSLSLKVETPTPGRRSSRLRKPLHREPVVAMPTLASPRKLPSKLVIDQSVSTKHSKKDDGVFEGMDTTPTDDDRLCDQQEQTKTQALVQDLQTLMAATRSYSKPRRKGRRLESSDLQQEESSEGRRSSTTLTNKPDETDMPSAKRQRRTPRSSKKSKCDKTECHTEPSQMYEVTWDDPSARAQQAMLASDLAKNSESFSPGGDIQHYSADNELIMADRIQAENHFSNEEDKQQSHDTNGVSHDKVTVSDGNKVASALEKNVTSPVSEKRPTPRFQFSGMSVEERVEFGAIVERLGGETSDTQHYDPSCSHLVIENPNKNEKYLASISAGKWVLHKSYLAACHKQGHFVKEEDHEWGGPGTASALTNKPVSMATLANAARRWRINLQQKREEDPGCLGVFQGWVVVLLADRKREASFKRLLEAGGANVVAAGESAPSLDNVTHAFIELNKTKVKVDIKAFVDAKVQCLRPDYLASFLLDEPAVSVSNYLIPQVHH